MAGKLHTLLKLMNEGILITDSAGRIYLSSEKAELLLVERSRVLQGVHIEEVLPEMDVRSTKEQLIRTKRKKPDCFIGGDSIKRCNRRTYHHPDRLRRGRGEAAWNAVEAERNQP